MRMVCLILFLLLALFEPSVQGVSISYFTRTTTGRLWTMATNNNDIHNMVVRKLRGYALDCCTNPTPNSNPPGYGLGLKKSVCETKQIAYWAYIEKWVYNGDTGMPDMEVLEDWLDVMFIPATQENLNDAADLCLGTGDETDDYPNFAIPDTGSGDIGHTEAKLMLPMSIRAVLQTGKQLPADFFLYTYKSPCGSQFTENCQKKIFQFTYDFIYPFDLPFHSLAVGFQKWYRGKGNTPIKTVRTSFCNSVTSLKNKNEYNGVDFYPGLFFKKVINEQDATGTGNDANFNPGNGNC